MDIGNIENGNVVVKILTTNETSITLQTEERFQGMVLQPGPAANRVSAEHGLAMSITISNGEKKTIFLIDTAGLAGTIIENSKQFNLNLKDVDKLILTHGHFDHFGSLNQVIPLLKEGCELILNPKCYEQYFTVITKTGEELPAENLTEALKESKDKIRVSSKLPSLNKTMIEKLAGENGVKIIETAEPLKLHDGIATSGEIKLSDESEVTKGMYIMKSRKEYQKSLFRDETSVYINIKDKGLAVITGCGHCGIMNTIKHAQELTGVDKVYAVIGGFHEEWNPKEVIEQKVNYLEGLNPAIICGMHCTGFEFNKQMSRHPSHTLGVVGTEFHL